MIDSQSIRYYIPTLKGNIEDITTLKRYWHPLGSKNHVKYSQAEQTYQSDIGEFFYSLFMCQAKRNTLANTPKKIKKWANICADMTQGK